MLPLGVCVFGLYVRIWVFCVCLFVSGCVCVCFFNFFLFVCVSMCNFMCFSLPLEACLYYSEIVCFWWMFFESLSISLCVGLHFFLCFGCIFVYFCVFDCIRVFFHFLSVFLCFVYVCLGLARLIVFICFLFNLCLCVSMCLYVYVYVCLIFVYVIFYVCGYVAVSVCGCVSVFYCVLLYFSEC